MNAQCYGDQIPNTQSGTSFTITIRNIGLVNLLQQEMQMKYCKRFRWFNWCLDGLSRLSYTSFQVLFIYDTYVSCILCIVDVLLFDN
jgi:hypothetical protein